MMLKQDFKHNPLFLLPNAQSAHKCESACVNLHQDGKQERKWRESFIFFSKQLFIMGVV